MPRASIRIVPLGTNDWLVKEDGGRELGHYENRQVAESVARKLARKRNAELLVQDATGDIRSERVSRGWLARLFGR